MKVERKNKCIDYSSLTNLEKINFIEPNIRCLVSSINSYDGIETFASCEGHEFPAYGGIRNSAYIAFKSNNDISLKYILNNIPSIECEKFYIKKEIDFSFQYNNEIHYIIRVWSDKKYYLNYLLHSLSSIVTTGGNLVL